VVVWCAFIVDVVYRQKRYDGQEGKPNFFGILFGKKNKKHEIDVLIVIDTISDDPKKRSKNQSLRIAKDIYAFKNPPKIFSSIFNHCCNNG